MIDATRRQFLGGIGAALVASAIPKVPGRWAISAGDAVARPHAMSVVARVLPRIARRVPLSTPWGMTAHDLLWVLIDLREQIASEIAPLRPTAEELFSVAANVDDELWKIRPAGLAIEIDEDFYLADPDERIVVRETGPGSLRVSRLVLDDRTEAILAANERIALDVDGAIVSKAVLR